MLGSRAEHEKFANSSHLRPLVAKQNIATFRSVTVLVLADQSFLDSSRGGKDDSSRAPLHKAAKCLVLNQPSNVAEGKQHNHPQNPATRPRASVCKHRGRQCALRWTES